MPKITELPSVDGLQANDIIVLVRDGLTSKALGSTVITSLIDATNVAIDGVLSDSWSLVPDNDWNITPPATNKIGASSGMFKLGLPIRYVQDGVTYFGIIGEIDINEAEITVFGPALDTGKTITQLAVGPPSRLKLIDFKVPGNFASAVANMLSARDDRYFRWYGPPARLVHFGATQKTPRGTDQPKVNAMIGSDNVSTNDSGNGILLSGTGGVWVQNPAGTIDHAKAALTFGADVELRCTATGSGSNAADLSMMLAVVYE